MHNQNLILLNNIIKKDADRIFPGAKKLINLQISTDFVILTVMLHYSGGVENPFMIYYIFHMIMASIVLSPRESYQQVSLALLLIGLLTILEYTALVPHYGLTGLVSHELYKSEIYLISTGIVFITTSYLVVYITNSIVMQSRKHEDAYMQANMELEKQDAIKNEYVLRITHDIKGHLAAINSCLKVVIDNISDSADSKCEEFLDRAYNRTLTLIRFIKDLLYITKLKLSDEFEFQVFSIRDSIQNVINHLEVSAGEKSVDIKVSIDESVDEISGVPLSIEELLSNLLSNAISYSKNNSEINLNVKDQKKDILVEVTDTGIGIPTDEKNLIFDEFYRASNVIKNFTGGTGLGLSIAKQIVQNHGGEIWVESEPGMGSRFCFTLPGREIHAISQD